MREEEYQFSLTSLIVPFTTSKAIHWIIFVGIIVYANMLFNGFVWDDVTYIIANPEVHSINLFKLFSENTFNSSGYYRPIPGVYFSILYKLFGIQQFGYHIIQLALHIICTILVLFFLKRFFSLHIAFFLSLIFLVHPTQVESVSYIGASQSELFFLFGMSALLISLKKHTSMLQMVTISVLVLLALLTKETSILFAIMIVIYQALFFPKRVRSFIIFILGSVGVYTFIRFGLSQIMLEHNNHIPIGDLPLHERLLSIPAIIFYYLQTLFFPITLSIDQLWFVKVIDLQHFYLPLMIDFAFLVLLLLFGYRVYVKEKSYVRLYVFFSVVHSWHGNVYAVFPS